MKILLNSLVLLGFALSLFVITRTFKIPHKEYYEKTDVYRYTKGNASPAVRAEIISQLQLFQEGYTARDTARIGEYMDSLFSKENILILGTMPKEIYSGFVEATDLVASDWLYWGDVKLLMEKSNVSSKGNIAWVSMIGYVEFDMFKYLVLPLRFSGVMTKENQTWKFQQVQFQFDLDNLSILFAIILLSILCFVSLLRLGYLVFKQVIKKT